MPERKQTMGSHAWAYKSETIERLPTGTYSIGVGRGIMKETGLSAEAIVAIVGPIAPDLVDEGADVGLIEGVRCYFRRRGKAVDLGSRSDFVDLGWEGICDLADEMFPKE